MHIFRRRQNIWAVWKENKQQLIKLKNWRSSEFGISYRISPIPINLDSQQIHLRKSAIQQSVGFDRVNHHVRDALVEWIGTAVRKQFQDLVVEPLLEPQKLFADVKILGWWSREVIVLEEVPLHLFVQHEVQSVYAFSLCLQLTLMCRSHMWQKRSTGKRCDQQKSVTLIFPVRIEVGQWIWSRSLVATSSKWGKHGFAMLMGVPSTIIMGKLTSTPLPPKDPKLPLTRNLPAWLKGLLYNCHHPLVRPDIEPPNYFWSCRWPPNRGSSSVTNWITCMRSFSRNLIRFAEAFFLVATHPSPKTN